MPASGKLIVLCLDSLEPHNHFRYGVSRAATGAIATAFLQDLIAAGHLDPEMSYLACDPNKIARARKAAMGRSQVMDNQKYEGEKIIGMGYDGRRDKQTRAMVADSTGKMKMRMITEEHEAVTEEPSGRYLTHFVPETPDSSEKPALKVAQGLLDILEQHNSTQSIQFLGGDSTAMNTGWKGGSHALLERLLGRRLYWGICNLHTNELPLRHLIAAFDGPTSSDKGFTGPVCSLLSRVNEMPFNPGFRALPGGEDLISIPEAVLKTMSTDQRTCYMLVEAVKKGILPEEMQEMLCGPLCHARFVTISFVDSGRSSLRNNLQSKPFAFSLRPTLSHQSQCNNYQQVADNCSANCLHVDKEARAYREQFEGS